METENRGTDFTAPKVCALAEHYAQKQNAAPKGGVCRGNLAITF
jgi:hypothetical protein